MNNAKIPPSDSYDEYHIKELQDINYAAVYLEAVIEDHDSEDIQTDFLKLALNDVAEALASEQLATHTETLEIILQKQGAEAIYGLADWLKGLGLKLTVTVDKEAEIQDFAPEDSIRLYRLYYAIQNRFQRFFGVCGYPNHLKMFNVNISIRKTIEPSIIEAHEMMPVAA